MANWQYKKITIDVRDPITALDAEGDSGWELVSVIPAPHSDTTIAILKKVQA